jgi:hypothetical protein
MNIFSLDKDPEKSARMMSNKHVVKMLLESAQLMCTTHRLLDGVLEIRKSITGRRYKYWKLPDNREHSFYKPTHYNHPSSLWVRESASNYYWLYFHFYFLNEEYLKRYGKIHLSFLKFSQSLKEKPVNLQDIGLTPFKLAISNQDYIVPSDSIQSYRNYYEAEKLFTEEDKKRYYTVIEKEKTCQ